MYTYMYLYVCVYLSLSIYIYIHIVHIRQTPCSRFPSTDFVKRGETHLGPPPGEKPFESTIDKRIMTQNRPETHRESGCTSFVT